MVESNDANYTHVLKMLNAIWAQNMQIIGRLENLEKILRFSDKDEELK